MYTVLVYLLPFFLSGVSHDFHVSRCEIVYRSESNSLEITQHMFADDVEIGLLKATGLSNPLHLSTELETHIADSVLQNYLAKCLEVVVDGKPIELRYLGREPGEDNAAMWVYIEGENCPPPGEMTIRYDALVEVFPDQKNILSFQKDNGDKKMFLLDRTNPETSFNPE